MICPDVSLYAANLPFPEGPAFGSDGHLYVCVRRDGWVARIAEDRTVSRWLQTGGKPQALALGPDGRLHLADAHRREILAVAPDGQLEPFVQTDAQQELAGPNDLCFGPSGDLFFTDPGLEWGHCNGRVYRYGAVAGLLTRLMDGIGFPNGIVVTPDESRLYVAESLSGRVLELDLTAPAKAPRVAAEFGPKSVPDGMKWLTDGMLAVALHEVGQIGVVDVARGTDRRLSLGDGALPTNLAVRDQTLFITDDFQAGVLQVPASV